MRATGIATALFTVVLSLASPVFADDADVGTTGNAFIAGANDAVAGTTRPAAQDLPPGRWEDRTVCALGGNQTCDVTAHCSDGSIMVEHDYVLASGAYLISYTNCSVIDEPTDPTPSDIYAAFQKIPMTASPLHIQPPEGETLVNFDTIFFTDPTTIDKQVTVLDATVDFHITVASYTWHYGDDATATTTTPGAAYPHQTIVHRYLRKGAMSVSLDTTYQADYRINGGPQQHLADTVTIAGAAQQLTVLTATPHLVGN
jgi:hypothetical protein